MIINKNKIIEIWKSDLYFIYFMKYREYYYKYEKYKKRDIMDFYNVIAFSWMIYDINHII